MISGAGATALVMVLVRAQSHHRQRPGSASMHAQQAFAHHTTKPCSATTLAQKTCAHYTQRHCSASMHAPCTCTHPLTTEILAGTLQGGRRRLCHVVQRGSRRTTRALSKQLEPVLLQTHARTRVCTYIVTKHTLAHCHVYLLVCLRSNARWHDQRKQLQTQW